VFLVLEHQRRRVLYFGVTEHPTAEWAAQQVVEAVAIGRIAVADQVPLGALFGEGDIRLTSTLVMWLIYIS
jgi:hypothetical protein